jgi:erythromycin esterase-like protein
MRQKLGARCLRWFFTGLLVTTPALGAALEGVTELNHHPQAVPDEVLERLLGPEARRADVVALGESVHGSAGFLRFQERLIRHLVERQGLRLLVWETGVIRSRALSAWLQRCTSKVPASVPIDVLYMPTRADLPLFEWLCAYNRKHADDPVHFLGMDVWDRTWEHFAVIRNAMKSELGAQPLATIARRCPLYEAASWTAVEAVLDEVQVAGEFRPHSDYRQCREALTVLMNEARRVGLQRRAAGSATAQAAFEVALSASTLLGWLGFYNDFWADDLRSWNERDAAQGRNLDLIMLMHGQSRAILSAHTSHVSHGRSPADWWGYGDLKSGVYFYTAQTGRRVFNLAFTGYEVSGTQGAWSLPVAPNSLDRTLQAAGHVLAYFSSKAPFLARHRTWWMQNGNFPGRYESGVEIVPPDHFDAFVFFASSHLDEALPARPMWRP